MEVTRKHDLFQEATLILDGVNPGPYQAVSSEEEALSVLQREFDLSPPELYDLSRSFLGLPRPHSIPEATERSDGSGTEVLPDHFPQVLGIVGYMRAGKDVVASFLEETYKGVCRMAYSDPIIAECNRFLSDWGHFISEENKDDYRLFLQNWSMARRSEEEDYWSRSLQEDIDRALRESRLVVLTGVRLPADVRLIELYEGEMWRVVRAGGKKSLHPNEAWIEQIRCQHVIHNAIEGDTGPLRSQIAARINSFR